MPQPTRGALRRLLGKLLFAGIGVTATPAGATPDSLPGDAEADTDDVVEEVIDAAIDLGDESHDPVAGGHALAIVLEHMHPLDAIRTAATAALSPRAEVRCALGEALTWIFPLAVDGAVLDHLSRDPEPAVRLASGRAAGARRPRHDAVLVRLVADPDPQVASSAILALQGR
jgi:hypothetical protein